MVQAYKCDICGKVYTEEELIKFIHAKENSQIHKMYKDLIRYDKDLCPSCMKYFAIWVENWKVCGPCGVPTDEY